MAILNGPPLCPEPQFVAQGEYLFVTWPCDCVPPNQTLTISMQAPAGTSLAGPLWAGGIDLEAACGGFVGNRPRIADLDGDRDGYPDTNETFELSLSLTNRWDVDVTNVVAHLSTTDPRLDCISVPTVSVGTVAAGATVSLPTPFRLHVAPEADRAGTVPLVVCTAGACSNGAGACSTAANCQKTIDDDYSAAVMVVLTGDQLPAPQALPAIAVDLDLDAAAPAMSTSTFAEGFEAGFGNFTFMNLDVGRASNSLSDGFRCQYSDPDGPNSNTGPGEDCFLGYSDGQTSANDWHIHTVSAPDGGHAYLGSSSLHYGVHTPNNPAEDTFGFNQMDAVRTKVSIRLAPRVCRDDPAPNPRACASDADCAVTGGGPCVGASPVLSFKHQVATTIDCLFGDPQTVDRGNVAAKLTSGGPWRKIEPFVNEYDRHANDIGCVLDPVDDGNDEDDYFDPLDPDRRYGPSTSCLPQKSFSVIGNTDLPFNPANIGHASDGPGLAGSLGQGTWIESQFDLSAYRGRTIQLRWLFTTLMLGDVVSPRTWSEFAPGFFHGCDDGWYVDDVRVTQSLGTVTATVSADTKDNSNLPGDRDCDAAPDATDCAPADPTAFALPEVDGVRFTDDTSLSWSSAIPYAGSGTVHDIVRGSLAELPVGGGASESCLLTGSPGASATESSSPVGGAGFWFLVRARNACGAGSYGTTSAAVPRNSTACP